MAHSSSKRIAIVGAGLTGLTAAYRLARAGYAVTVFEKDGFVGGLASGFRGDGWAWPLEKAYHHFFTSDRSLIALLTELDMGNDIMISRPVTANLWHDKAYPFDSPMNLLAYPGMPFPDRVRTGMVAAFAKLNPFWKPLEDVTAESFFRMLGGATSWDAVWSPLMRAKFGTYAPEVAASWLWARLHTRTARLGYIAGGFQTFAETLASKAKASGADILLDTTVSSMKKTALGQWRLSYSSAVRRPPSAFEADTLLLTVPSFIASRLIPFPEDFARRITSIPHLWAQCLILETKTPILDRVYWLSVTDPSYPFLAVVAHTNFIDKRHYNGHHLTYIGNYLPEGHRYLKMDKAALLDEFLPHLKKIASPLSPLPSAITQSHLFTAPFAQPVHTRGYSKKAPTLKTPVPGVYLANLDSIYPWDRGTNYAVALGNTAASRIIADIA